MRKEHCCSVFLHNPRTTITSCNASVLKVWAQKNNNNKAVSPEKDTRLLEDVSKEIKTGTLVFNIVRTRRLLDVNS